MHWAAGFDRRGGARAIVPEDAKLVATLRRVLGRRLEHKGELAQLQAVLVGVVGVQLPRAEHEQRD